MSKSEVRKKSAKKIIVWAGISLVCAFLLKRDTVQHKV